MPDINPFPSPPPAPPGGGGGSSTDVTDRVGRLLGVVNSITNAVDISDRAARLLGVSDVSDRAGRLLGVVASITNPVDVSDRAGRLLGVVASITNPVDVSDRIGRLIGSIAIPLNFLLDGTGTAQPVQFFQANVTTAQTGVQLVAAPAAGRSIRVLSYAVVAGGVNNVSFIGMPTTLLLPFAANGGISFGGGAMGPAWQNTAATALTYTTSAAVQTTIHGSYVIV